MTRNVAIYPEAIECDFSCIVSLNEFWRLRRSIQNGFNHVSIDVYAVCIPWVAEWAIVRCIVQLFRGFVVRNPIFVDLPNLVDVCPSRFSRSPIAVISRDASKSVAFNSSSANLMFHCTIERNFFQASSEM
jgi:hypothetical protein